jgi:hypothetical protein
MSIKFTCVCGKRLRARDDMAARRSFCPRCGAPIGVPSQSTRRGTSAGPMTPGERSARGNVVETAASTAADELFAALQAELNGTAPPPGVASPGTPARKLRPRRHIPRQLETRWYQCLAYPFRAWPLLASLAAVLTALSGMVASPLVPAFLQMWNERPDELWLWAVCSIGPLVALGYVCGTLDCVLCAGISGEVQSIRWPGYNLALVVRSALTWLFCFLAGPVVPLALAVVYWYNAGDLDWLDRWILAEMCIIAFGYWFFALVAVYQRERLLDANPVKIGELVGRLGAGLFVIALLAAVGSWFHVRWLFAALGEIHTVPLLGVLSVFVCWLSVLMGATFFFRLVGIWCYRAGPLAPATAKH